MKKPLITPQIEQLRIDALFFESPPVFMGFPFYLKIEGMNLAGSIKLKPALHMITELINSGKLKIGTHVVIESSSGNLGVALSIVCKSRGIPFICVCDPNTNPHHLKLLKLYGAEVICVQERDENGGYLGTRIATIQRMLEENPHFIWTNQYANPHNPDAHQKTTAIEIDNAFPKLDYLFIGAGTTGTLMGCIEYFHQHPHPPKIIAVDVEGSVTFGLPAKKRNIPGLGTSKTPPIFKKEAVKELIIVSETETIDSCRNFLEITGLLLGGSSGSVLSAIKKYAPHFKKGDCIVGIAPDLGERYLDTIYNPEWVQTRIIKK